MIQKGFDKTLLKLLDSYKTNSVLLAIALDRSGIKNKLQSERKSWHVWICMRKFQAWTMNIEHIFMRILQLADSWKFDRNKVSNYASMEFKIVIRIDGTG